MHHTDTVTSITLCTANSEERFASISNDGTICIWAFLDEDPLHIIKLKDEMVSYLENQILDLKF
jgi:WD40 repeat protein